MYDTGYFLSVACLVVTPTKWICELLSLPQRYTSVTAAFYYSYGVVLVH